MHRWTPITILSIEVASEPCRSPKFLFRARFDLPHALARQAHPISDLPERPGLVVLQAGAQAHDLALPAVQIAQRRGELVEIGLMNHLLLNWRHLLLWQRIAEPSRSVWRHRLVE